MPIHKLSKFSGCFFKQHRMNAINIHSNRINMRNYLLRVFMRFFSEMIRNAEPSMYIATINMRNAFFSHIMEMPLSYFDAQNVNNISQLNR
jgi:hypothetical protein